MTPATAPAGALGVLAGKYLSFRRSLGFEMDKPGFLVRRFAGYCDGAGITRVTDQAVLDWILLAQPAAPSYRWLRLNAARGFAIYLHALDPAHQVPPPDLVPCRRDRPAPCIMTGEQIETLMDTAGTARGHLPDADRPDRGHRDANLRGRPRRRQRHRPGRGRDDVARQEPKGPADTAAPHHAGRARRLPAAPRPADTRLCRAEPAGQHPRTPAERRPGPHAFRAPGRQGRPRRPHSPPDAAGPAPHVRRHHADRLAERRRRHPGMPPAAPGSHGTHQAAAHLLVPAGRSRTTAGRERPHAPGRRPRSRRPGRLTTGGDVMSDLAPILQGFFRVKLMQHKDASPHTIASYRDTWRLLLHYAQQATGTPPEKMRLAQLDHDLVTGFLHHLDTERGNAARTRNNRLAAIHSMFRYAALHAPDDAEVIQRVLSIESARTGDTEIPWLTPEETAAVLAAPDRGTWTGRRDHAMMTVLLATGLRISELLSLTRADARIRPAGSHVRCTGKGRRDRSTPLDPASAAVLGEWLDRTSGQPADPLFPARARTIRKLTRDGFQARLDKYQEIASQDQPSLAGDPHVHGPGVAEEVRGQAVSGH